MNVPYLSLTLTRRFVTELVRSPRATSALAPRPKLRPTRAHHGTVAPVPPGTATVIAGAAVPMIPQTSQRAV